jgi:CarD family transcriptional regulator
MSREEIDDLLDKIKSIDLIKESDRKLEFKYKELLDSDSPEDLVRIIKTAYLRNKNRIDNKRKISEKDKHYFDLAEHYLYNEISVVMGMSFDETREYIIEKMDK